MSLSNFDLEKIATELKINLVCVVSKNELSKIVPRSGGYIVNLQSSDAGDGTHWVCFILYNVFDNKKKKQLKGIYMDTYGMLPPIEIENFIHKYTDFKIAFSKRQIQKINTSECGWYCLSFIYCMQYKRQSNSMLDDLERWLGMFSSDLTLDLPILKRTFSPYTVDFFKKTIKL
jgi:hypothetical protein